MIHKNYIPLSDFWMTMFFSEERLRALYWCFDKLNYFKKLEFLKEQYAYFFNATFQIPRSFDRKI